MGPNHAIQPPAAPEVPPPSRQSGNLSARNRRCNMATSLEPVRPITLEEIGKARVTIARTVLRTPLIRLDTGSGGPEIRLKLENLQPTNSYKLRGAANPVAMVPESARRQGVWTISAGNAGQGIAYAARQAGVSCSVVVIETAPAAKIARMRALGAT